MAASDHIPELTILPELQTWLPGVPDRTYAELEAMLLKDGGPLDPITAWKHEGQAIVVDGHRRYEICRKHNLKFKVRYLEFADMASAKHWMDCYQTSRRNLSDHEQAIVITRMCQRVRELTKYGGGEAAAAVGKMVNLTPRQVYRLKNIGTALEKLPEDIRQRIIEGDIKATARDLEVLAAHDEMDQRAILNEFDSRRKDGHCHLCGKRMTDEACPDGCEPTKKPRFLATVLHGIGNEGATEDEIEDFSGVSVPVDDEPEPDSDDIEEDLEDEEGYEGEYEEGKVETESELPPPYTAPRSDIKSDHRPASRVSTPVKKTDLEKVKESQTNLGKFAKSVDELSWSTRRYNMLRFKIGELGELLAKWRAELENAAAAEAA